MAVDPVSLRDRIGQLDAETTNLVSLMSAIVTHAMVNTGMSPEQIRKALSVVADPAFMRLLIASAPTFEAAGRVVADQAEFDDEEH
jgi:hypothetical protein